MRQRVTTPHFPVDPDSWFDDLETQVFEQPIPHPPRRIPQATPPPQLVPTGLTPLRPVAPVRPQTLAQPRRRRRWIRRLVVIAIVAGLLVGAGIFGAITLVRHQIRDTALPALAAKLDRAVTAGDIDVSWGEVIVHDLEVEALASIDRVVVRFTVTDLLGAKIRLDSIDAHGVGGGIDRAELDALLERLAGEAADAATGARDGGRVDASGVELTAHDITFRATDRERELAATFTAETAEPIEGGVSITGATLTLGPTDRDSRLVRLLVANPVAGVSGELTRDGGTIHFNLAGGFVDSDETWRASGGARGGDDLEIRLGGESVAVSRLLAVAALVSDRRLPIADTPGATVGGDLTVTTDGQSITARGTVEMDGLAIASARLAREPVALVGSLELDASVARDGSSARLDKAVWRASRAPKVGVSLVASASRAPKKLSARLEIPRAACADVLAAIPATLVPELQGFELAGELEATVELAIDWSDLDDTAFNPAIALDGCEVIKAPAPMSADRLRGSFEHTTAAGGIARSFVVGPENPDFVPVDKVSRNLIRSLLTTEDGSFWRHRGFRLDAFRTALVRNLKQGRFAYGGSSITMQMVKNVMLGREKTISRKLQELFLTWYVERELPKKRILEIYVNAIEFGPGLYGIKPAARQYFAKHPRRLNPVESAFFSSILPAPRRRFRQYCRGYVAGWTRNKMDRIIDLMFDRNRLDPDAYLTAIETPLIFRGNRRELCKYLKEGAK